MVIEAFVLPYLGRSAGVVFWEPRRGAAGRGNTPARPGRGAAGQDGQRGAEADALTVYAPGELSAGEVAELQGCFVSSLGRTLREGGPGLAAEGALRWWWVGGIFAAVVLALRALELGPGYAWLAFVVAVTALPLGAAGVVWPAGRRRVVLARRLARRAAHLVAAGGADARAQERLDGLWRLAGRLQGPAGQQLRELEAYCREHAWRPAAQFYADQLIALGATAAAGGEGSAGRRRRLWPWRERSRPGSPLYAVREMRAW